MESQHFPKKTKKNRTREAGNFFQIPTTPNISLQTTELTQQTWRVDIQVSAIKISAGRSTILTSKECVFSNHQGNLQ